jgi:hypothetical protein
MGMKTKNGKDLEAEVIARCVKAIELEGRRGKWVRKLEDSGTHPIKRVLLYLASRYGVQL